jgi:hypothetical protein
VEQIKAANARQWHGKHMSMAINKHVTGEELSETMFSMLSILKLYSEGKQLLSCKMVVISPELSVALLDTTKKK